MFIYLKFDFLKSLKHYHLFFLKKKTKTTLKSNSNNNNNNKFQFFFLIQSLIYFYHRDFRSPPTLPGYKEKKSNLFTRNFTLLEILTRFFFLINIGVRASLYISRLILWILKLIIMKAFNNLDRTQTYNY